MPIDSSVVELPQPHFLLCTGRSCVIQCRKEIRANDTEEVQRKAQDSNGIGIHYSFEKEKAAHGNTHCQLTINGGNVLMEGLDIRAKNLFGMPLVAVRIEENSFEKQIDTDLGSYIYRAQRDADHPDLCVFLPEEA
jgi:hypothetical protein